MKDRLAWLLFFTSIFVYLFTRLFKIEDFPIYFFCDEAIQAVKAEELIKQGLKDEFGNFLPPLIKGFKFNLGVSIYLNIPSVFLFGKKIWAVRGTTAFISFIATIFVSLTFKNIFKLKNYWIGVIYLACVPVFFLHSRTGFETVIATSFFAICLYFYFQYRKNGLFGPLTLSLLFAFLAFLSYTGIWVVIIITFLLFFLFDIFFHLKNWKNFLFSLLIFSIFLFPTIQFGIQHFNFLADTFKTYDSFFLEKNAPPKVKLAKFWQKYALAFNYHFLFDSRQASYHPRHHLKGYGYFPLWSLPFFLLGLFSLFFKINQPNYRIILITLLTTPIGGALIEPGSTRNMPMVISLTFLFGLGIKTLEKILDKMKSTSLLTLFSLSLFFFLAITSILMTYDSLNFGPLWFQDYGLYGMQYGAKQLFSEVNQALETYDYAIVSPNFVNGADVFLPFFLDEEKQKKVKLASGDDLEAFNLLPNGKKIIFALPDEYENLRKIEVVKAIEIKKIIFAPNGKPAFYKLELHFKI